MLRKFPGAIAILDPLRRRAATRFGRVVIDDFDSDIAIEVDLSEHIGSQIFWFGSYSRDILIHIDRILMPGMVALDIGANIGEISLFMAKRVGPSGSVHSFEPVPELADQLEANAWRNGFAHMHVHRVCVSDGMGEITLFTRAQAFSDQTMHGGLASMFASLDRPQEQARARMVTLDSWSQGRLPRLDLMKLDIEGAELLALRGASRVLDEFRPTILIEADAGAAAAAGTSLDAILDLLEKHRYESWIIGWRGRLVPVTRGRLGDYQNLLCRPIPSR